MRRRRGEGTEMRCGKGNGNGKMAGRCGNGCGGGIRDAFEGSLAELPVGMIARVIRVEPALRGRKKFADIGIVPGTELLMEAHAPFGGLLRVKVMETSMALHRDDAANIVMKKEDEAE